jgi:glycosyltransferase involved in cell wall biosynthesis
MKVTALINCCYEGLLLKKSLDSAVRSIDASGFAAECELVVVADSASEPTLDVLVHYEDRVHEIVRTEVSDLGLARNLGVAAARGELILFLDGDDLWGRNWVGAAWAEHLTIPRMAVLHPQYSVFFGARLELLVGVDWREPHFDPRALVVRNHWTSPCGVRRDLVAEYPFPKADAKRRFGFEDWSWYADLTARGVRHVTVPQTAHFIRLKAVDSMQKAMNGYFRIPSLAFAEYLAADDQTRPYDL